VVPEFAFARGASEISYILIVDSQAEFRHQLVVRLEQAGHRAAAVATVSEATRLIEDEVPDLLATDGVLTDSSSANLVQQVEAAGAKILSMTGNPDRVIELDGAAWFGTFHLCSDLAGVGLLAGLSICSHPLTSYR